MARIQFILKARAAPFIGEAPPTPASKFLSSGLLNSASFVADMARGLGHTVEVVHAVDNNCIDRLVSQFRPDLVIIEAFWVVPNKFAILHRLHPKVRWLIRNHSALPFVANEGIAMDWSLSYMKQANVMLCCNDRRADQEMRDLVRLAQPGWSAAEVDARVFLLPNYYPESFYPRPARPASDTLDIACFGALRPLKNHLAQAVAAIRLAQRQGKHLRFHINGTRIEMKGEPILHNLLRTFEHLPFELVNHPWLAHDAFCALLQQMDVLMQCSYTETFNIVAADAISHGVPVVTSPDILWSDPQFQADPNSTDSMIAALERALGNAPGTEAGSNLARLRDYAEQSRNVWAAQINRLTGVTP